MVGLLGQKIVCRISLRNLYYFIFLSEWTINSLVLLYVFCKNICGRKENILCHKVIWVHFFKWGYSFLETYLFNKHIPSWEHIFISHGTTKFLEFFSHSTTKITLMNFNYTDEIRVYKAVGDLQILKLYSDTYPVS